WNLHASGRVRSRPGDGEATVVDLAAARARCPDAVPVEEVYRALEARGLQYRGLFRGIQEMWRGRGEAFARIALPEQAASPYHVPPARLDSAFQALLAAAESSGMEDGGAHGLYLPVSLGRLTLGHVPGTRFWAHARITQIADQALVGEIPLVGEDGRAAM